MAREKLNDPIFACGSPNFPLAPGWYLVNLDMQQHDGMPVKGMLYPDYGPDVPPDMQGMDMPFRQTGPVVASRRRAFHPSLVWTTIQPGHVALPVIRAPARREAREQDASGADIVAGRPSCRAHARKEWNQLAHVGRQVS